jgi:hypothetical protein
VFIDFDWSGVLGDVFLPAAVQLDSFGLRARPPVGPMVNIDPDFDWVCLADILDSLVFHTAAEAAAMMNADSEISQLQLFPNICNMSNIHAGLSPSLDLSQFGLRDYTRYGRECGS